MKTLLTTTALVLSLASSTFAQDATVVVSQTEGQEAIAPVTEQRWTVTNTSGPQTNEAYRSSDGTWYVRNVTAGTDWIAKPGTSDSTYSHWTGTGQQVEHVITPGTPAVDPVDISTYTVEGADNKFATKGDLSTTESIVSNNALDIATNTGNIQDNKATINTVNATLGTQADVINTNKTSSDAADAQHTSDISKLEADLTDTINIQVGINEDLIEANNTQDIRIGAAEDKANMLQNELIKTNNTVADLAEVAGKDGIDGADGKDGVDGINGRDGLNGKDGADGADGQDGAQGIQGERGETGATGAQGERGLQGEQGIQGIQGETGAAGANGTDGVDGVDGDDFNGDARLTTVETRSADNREAINNYVDTHNQFVEDVNSRISTDSEGRTHIGENSLITYEETKTDGTHVQVLTAEDAAGETIAIEYKGSELATRQDIANITNVDTSEFATKDGLANSIANVQGKIDANTAAIAGNAAQISGLGALGGANGIYAGLGNVSGITAFSIGGQLSVTDSVSVNFGVSSDTYGNTPVVSAGVGWKF